MSKLYDQASFIGGLNAQFDTSKSPPNSYPLGINLRTRRNNIVPTRQHKNLNGPVGNYQGLCSIGSVLILFVSGIAYYMDVDNDTLFRPIIDWTAFDSELRMYMQLVPRTSNKFNRKLITAGDSEASRITFNNSIAAFPESLIVGNKRNQPQAIMPDLTAEVLATYEQWTLDVPEYVPIGGQMTFNGTKLFMASPDGKTIPSSVSGRPTDFVQNITITGDKGGDASTTAYAVSFNEVTGLFSTDDGDVVVTTLHATHVLGLTYDQTVFGEPRSFARPLFPVGCVNERSFARINGATVFISQNGIQQFNAVQQAQVESNSLPLGATIRDILENPQSETCAANYDLFTLFSVATIHGRGVMVYDETLNSFSSLDLSFGHVTQFATTKSAGTERLFYITKDNAVYEAFAGDTVDTAQVYIGDFVSGSTEALVRVEGVNLTFTDIVAAGSVKITLYIDGLAVYEATQPIPCEPLPAANEEEIPFTSRTNTVPVNFKFDPTWMGFKAGLMIKWNAEAGLCAIGLTGGMEKSKHIPPVVINRGAVERFAFVADTGFGQRFGSTGGCIPVTVGRQYLFNPRAGGAQLASGNTHLTSMGYFVASGSEVYVNGDGFSLQDCTDFGNLCAAITKEDVIAVIGGGDHSYDSGTRNEVAEGFFLLPYKRPFYATAGNHDLDTGYGEDFFARLGRPRYYTQAFKNIEFFFYNGGWTTNNAVADEAALTSGPTGEPDGNDINSIQAAWLQTELANSTRRFKIVVTHFPPFSVSVNHFPGYAAVRLPYRSWGASGMLSGHDHLYARWDLDGFMLITCGLGGHSIYSPVKNIPKTVAAIYNSAPAYVLVEVDDVEARFTTKTAAGDIIDRHTITV